MVMDTKLFDRKPNSEASPFHAPHSSPDTRLSRNKPHKPAMPTRNQKIQQKQTQKTTKQ